MTTLRWGGVTDVGRARSANQDAFFAGETLFAVADGMGGHAAGEVASSVAIGVFEGATVTVAEDLVALVRRANRAVIERAEHDAELAGMGTTLCSVALVHDEVGSDGSVGADRMVIANVGDSRVYLLHDGALTQITTDHSLVEDLVREGRLSPEEARLHPKRNILTRVLGNVDDLEVDSWDVLCRRGDRFLLCSDGLFNEVDDDRIASVLRRLELPEEAARELLRLANEGGGRDNITVVVVDVIDDGGAGESASASLADSPKGLDAAAAADLHNIGPSLNGHAPSVQAPDSRRVHRRSSSGRRSASSRRSGTHRPTWRAGLFVAALLTLLAAAFFSITWFAENSYYVGVDDGEVTIFKGRPGGVLWIEPEIEEGTGMSIEDVPVARRDAIRTGKQHASLEAARDYVANIEELLESQRPSVATTTPTIPTTTTIPSSSLPTNPPVTGPPVT